MGGFVMFLVCMGICYFVFGPMKDVLTPKYVSYDDIDMYEKYRTLVMLLFLEFPDFQVKYNRGATLKIEGGDRFSGYRIVHISHKTQYYNGVVITIKQVGGASNKFAFNWTFDQATPQTKINEKISNDISNYTLQY